MKDLASIIGRDQLVSKVIAIDSEAFLVGGYIRDLLRGVRSKDIDFVTGGDIRRLASMVFPGSGVTVVEFKRAMTLRVVAGDYTIDFSELRGDIKDDLSLRDFTMNAIAWSHSGGIKDPLGGVSDIRAKRIIGISERNFMDDPLRLLRAYRFAGEFGWKIDRQTRKTIGRLKHLIRESAVERITLEIIRLLNSGYCLAALRTALTDNLLGELFSLDRKELERNIRALSRLDSCFREIHEGSAISIGRTLSQGLTYHGLLRAEQLLSGSDMEKNHIRLSRATYKRVAVIGRLLKEYEERANMKRDEVFEIFTEAGNAAMDFAILRQRRSLLREAERFLSMRPVLSAQTVMDITGCRPGRELGALLKEMKKMQFLGRIRDEDEALRWLSQG